MANFACDNKLLMARKTRNSYAGLHAVQKDFMLLVGQRIQYLVKSSAAKHAEMHLKKKTTGTMTDPAPITISEEGDS